MSSVSSKRREAFLAAFPPGKQWEAIIDQIAVLTAEIEALAGKDLRSPKWQAMIQAFDEIRQSFPKEQVKE